MIDLNEFNELAYIEAERIAYNQGDNEKAALIARIIELEQEKEEQKEEIEGLKESISDFEEILNKIREIV
jgi:predicted nuclease with TOPRIM domain